MKKLIINDQLPVLKKFSFILLFLTVSFCLFSTSVVDPGTEVQTASITCGGRNGDLSVKTGVHFTHGERENLAHYEKGISLGYTGNISENCYWLQFVYRQIIIHRRPAGAGPPAPRPKSGPITTSGGTYELTTDPADPNYNVDSGSSDPNYDTRGANIRNPNSTTIFDKPGSGIKEADKNDPNVTNIESIISLNTFLVCGGKICAKVAWSMTYTWTPGPGGGTETGPVPDVSTPEIPGTLNDKQKDRFRAQYPGRRIPD